MIGRCVVGAPWWNIPGSGPPQKKTVIKEPIATPKAGKKKTCGIWIKVT